METIYALVLAVALQSGGVEVHQMRDEPLELTKCIELTEVVTVMLDADKSKGVKGFTVYCVPIHVPAKPKV